MSELASNPDKMARLKEELKNVAGEKKLLEESDMARLPYLVAVMKEVMRMHPPGSFLLPRKAESDREVNGDSDTLQRLGHGKRSEHLGESGFLPARTFSGDLKGNDFKLFSFGLGLRVCPGMPLGNQMLHRMTATLLHNFDWKLEPGSTDADQKSKFTGFSVRRTAQLRIIPLKP